ncbi:carbon-nitrogen hydrolase family protein [Streptomyces sp. NPDC046821]|uniref:carbon-nitrogen hydrolase family protein n=1 Tax=Streptomyces sp. NPDC046821 TaxID=3154702 RepID=UPI003405A6C1
MLPETNEANSYLDDGRDTRDPRLDVVRESGIATVVNCAAATDGPRPAIETLVFGADGELLTSYRKQHLFEHEQAVFTAGQHDGRFELGGVLFALATCYDNHFPDLTSRGSADGCQVHLASSLYDTGGGVDELAAVYPGIAKDLNMSVVLANHVGPAGAWIGCGRMDPRLPRLRRKLVSDLTLWTRHRLDHND